MKAPEPGLYLVGAWFVALPLAVAGRWIGYGWMWLPIFAGLLIAFWYSQR